MGTLTLSKHSALPPLSVDGHRDRLCLLGSLRSLWWVRSPSAIVTLQMLWINLIMDTFAAMALASLPPSESVMQEKSRDRNAFILNRPMLCEIIGVGVFFAMLLVLLYIFQRTDVTQLTDLLGVQLTLARSQVLSIRADAFFTIFVMTHFFYLFNARAFETGRSALHFKGCCGLLSPSLRLSSLVR